MVCIASIRSKFVQKALRNQSCIALDADSDRLRQANTGLVDVNLNELYSRWPIRRVVSWQSRERVEPGAQCEDHISLCNQLHGRLGTIVTERSRVQWVVSWESIVVLVIA